MFCQVTGYNGTTQRVEQASERHSRPHDARDLRRQCRLRACSGISSRSSARSIRSIGETIQVNFVAENRSNETQRGQAVFNVTPGEAGAYFNKVQCFCFTETDLKPGEKLEMPVVFYIDPEIVKAVEIEGHPHGDAVIYVLPERGAEACGFERGWSGEG